jgi:hypothetical protein
MYSRYNYRYGVYIVEIDFAKLAEFMYLNLMSKCYFNIVAVPEKSDLNYNNPSSKLFRQNKMEEKHVKT